MIVLLGLAHSGFNGSLCAHTFIPSFISTSLAIANGVVVFTCSCFVVVVGV